MEQITKIFSINRVHQRFEEQKNLETPSFSWGSLTVGLVVPFSDVKEASGRLPHVFYVPAHFSFENLDIISSSPLNLAVTCPVFIRTINGGIWKNSTICLREGELGSCGRGCRAVRTWKSDILSTSSSAGMAAGRTGFLLHNAVFFVGRRVPVLLTSGVIPDVKPLLLAGMTTVRVVVWINTWLLRQFCVGSNNNNSTNSNSSNSSINNNNQQPTTNNQQPTHNAQRTTHYDSSNNTTPQQEDSKKTARRQQEDSKKTARRQQEDSKPEPEPEPET